MLRMHNNACEVDIRKIQLRKAINPNGKPSDAQWYTWGQYDELIASKVRYGDATEQPLLTIWKDSISASNELNGEFQYFVQYLYKTGDAESIESFWEAIDDAPLLVVTMLYYDKQVLRNKEALYPEDIERELKQQIAFQHGIKSAIVYSALDNCDAVIIWSTQSLRAVLNVITQLSNSNKHIVSTYSTFAFHKKMLRETVDKDSCTWSDEDRANLVIRLHGSYLPNVRDVASKVKEYYQQNKAEVTVVAGQDDILIYREGVLLNKSISIYREDAPLYPRLLLERGVICDTIIGFEIDTASMMGSTRMQANTSIVTQLIKTLRTGFDNEPYPLWFAPLCETLNELSCFEYDNTTTHVFYQLLGVQAVFINYLCKRLSSKQYFTPYEDEDILNYLEKWSHVSFHSQKAYWKLTQETDINHIYLFPNKLCLLYAAYAHFVSKALTNSNADSYCAFLLSPTLGHAVSFAPVHLPDIEHTRVVFGELPASYIFHPRFLLPLLIHEIAHYVGGDVRQRAKRSKCCFIALFLTYSIEVIKSMGIQEVLNIEERNAMLTYLATKAIQFYVTDGEKPRMQRHMTGEQDISTTWLDDIANGAFYHIVYLAIQHTVSSDRYQEIGKHIHTEGGSGVQQPIKPIDITRRAEHIKNVYQESFSDLCMVRVLDMSASEYIRCVLWNASCTTPQEVESYIHARSNRLMVGRIIAVLSIMLDIPGYEPMLLEEAIRKQMTCLHNRSDLACIAFECLIQEISGNINGGELQSKKKQKLMLPINSLMLIIYLKACDERLAESIISKENVMKVRQLYNVMGNEQMDKEAHKVYHDYVKAYIDEICELAHSIADP